MTRDRVLLLDHRDSFVHVLADRIARLDVDVDVVRSSMSLDEWHSCLAAVQPLLVVLSPGPGHPADATLARAFLATRPQVPVFGVCLGHQVIGLSAGDEVGRAVEPVHGEACEIEWLQQPFGADVELPRRMPVARYHSLHVVRAGSRAPLTTLATARHRGRELVMAMQHNELPQLGVQFHPESVLTPHGQLVLQGVGPADPGSGENDTLFLATVPMGVTTDPEVTDGHSITWESVGSWTGMVIKNDPGQPVIWIAFGLLIMGLVLTFYFPRRRVWARVTDERVELAFVADRYVDADREFGRLTEAVEGALKR